MSNELQGKHALVTGAGRGIGAAVAVALAERGASLVLAARTGEQIEAVAATIRDAGGAALAVTCDVGDEKSVEQLHEAALTWVPQIDILVNNAGVADSAPLERISLDAWNRILRVNATGTFLCTRAFAPAMAERGWGRVVNVASVAAVSGGRYIAAYAASKHAVLGLTRSVALEFAARGVTVNAVCPGYVDTGMTGESLENIMSRTGLGREEALGAVLGDMPQHRLLAPEEVAHAVVSLCHPDARGVTGQAIVIDGGRAAS